MIMAGALSVTPVHTYVSTYVCPDDVRSLNQIRLIQFYETWSHCLVPQCILQVR